MSQVQLGITFLFAIWKMFSYSTTLAGVIMHSKTCFLFKFKS